MKSRLKTWFGHPAWAPSIVGGAVLLCMGSLGNGLVMDDLIQQLMVQGGHDLPWAEAGPFDLYSLIPEDDAFRERAVETGISPWWGSSSFRAVFWRPLSSLTLYMDHILWPDAPWAMHLHSLLWLGVMLMLASALYRQVHGSGWLAGLAIALYALDDAHIMPATWVANRNSMIATAFALMALIAHHRWRGANWRKGAVLGPLALLVGLLAGEFAIGTLAYLISYAVFLEQGRWSKRAATLAPYLAVIICWRVTYSLLGFGAHGSEIYLDPLSEPVSFMWAAVRRLPVLAGALIGLPGAEVHVMLPRAFRWVHLGAGLAWGAFFVTLAWPLLRRDVLARFWALGMILSLVPVCATFVHDRLLLLAGIGAMGLVAQFIGLFIDKPDWLPQERSWRIPARVVLVALVAVHLVISPLLTPPRATLVKTMGQVNERLARSIEPGARFSEQTLVVVNGPDLFTTAFLPVWRTALRLPNPARLEVLANVHESLTIERDSERSLILRTDHGQFQVWTHELVRRASDRWDAGRTRQRPGVLYEVLDATESGQPRAIRVSFDKPLEDPLLRLVNFDGHDYVDFELPAIGDSAVTQLDASEIFDVDAP